MDSCGFICRLQMAMYTWAEERKYVKVRRFNGAELEERPEDETKDVIGGQPMEHPSEMLPLVSELLEDLRLEIGDPRASEKDIKIKMAQLTTQVNRESTEAMSRDTKRARLEGDTLGRTSDA